jgi:hypothetical protein
MSAPMFEQVNKSVICITDSAKKGLNIFHQNLIFLNVHHIQLFIFLIIQLRKSNLTNKAQFTRNNTDAIPLISFRLFHLLYNPSFRRFLLLYVIRFAVAHTEKAIENETITLN